MGFEYTQERLDEEREHNRAKCDWPTTGWYGPYWELNKCAPKYVLRDGITIQDCFHFDITESYRWYRKARGWQRDDENDRMSYIRIGGIKMHSEDQVHYDNDKNHPWRQTFYREDVRRLVGNKWVTVDKTKPHIVLSLPWDVHHITLDRSQARKLARILFKFAVTGVVQKILPRRKEKLKQAA